MDHSYKRFQHFEVSSPSFYKSIKDALCCAEINYDFVLIVEVPL